MKRYLLRFLSCAPIALAILASLASAAEPAFFRSARPIWPAGRETEMNLSVGFRAVLEIPEAARDKVSLRVAAATIYRAWVNGTFAGYGPARGPHGYYRVDTWDLAGKLHPGKNLVAIEVAGYNVNSYYLLDQPSFLQAEVLAGDQVLASTAGGGTAMAATILESRVQKVQRYSFQRPFIEVYHLSEASDRWRRDPPFLLTATATAIQAEKRLLPRRVPYPEFACKLPLRLVGSGAVVKQPAAGAIWKDRSLVNIGEQLKGYPEKELATVVSTELQNLYAPVMSGDLGRQLQPGDAMRFGDATHRIVDMGANLTGFLGAKLSCPQKCRLTMVFDEILSAGDVDFKRLGCVNAISYTLEPGTYAVESIEPYTLRYLKLICLEGECIVFQVYLREYAHPQPRGAKFACSDERLNKLFAAGVLTFRENCVDLFMDCPSRERAGWLCDSFFTARVAADLTGMPLVEHNFVENFLLPEKFAHLPEGMLPMCYPADHNDGVFIPNWAMWFVVQLEEYLARSGDRATVEALRPRVQKLLAYLGRFENSDGLLEKLPSWVFVEWSAANQFVQDVNYPTNMLYAGALSAAGRIYGQPEMASKAEKIRRTIRRQSFDGQFFVDNALRRGGKLQATRNRSEVCQYFAFFFGVADHKTHAALWNSLRDEFGPQRAKTKAHAEVHPANSFIGNMLRMELLSQAGRGQQILDESIAYLLYMADRTGTLWENVGAEASCNHGFASHIVHTLYRDVLGLYRVDPRSKTVHVRLADLRLDWCEGSLLTPDGPIELRWDKQNGRLTYRLKTPAGYKATVENLTGKPIESR